MGLEPILKSFLKNEKIKVPSMIMSKNTQFEKWPFVQGVFDLVREQRINKFILFERI